MRIGHRHSGDNYFHELVHDSSWKLKFADLDSEESKSRPRGSLLGGTRVGPGVGAEALVSLAGLLCQGEAVLRAGTTPPKRAMLWARRVKFRAPAGLYRKSLSLINLTFLTAALS